PSSSYTLSLHDALPILLIIYLGQRLELIKDFGFLRRFKQGVAAEAASKWSQSGAQIESVQNLESLFHRLLRTQVVAVPDDCMHQDRKSTRLNSSHVKIS